MPTRGSLHLPCLTGIAAGVFHRRGANAHLSVGVLLCTPPISQPASDWTDLGRPVRCGAESSETRRHCRNRLRQAYLRAGSSAVWFPVLGWAKRSACSIFTAGAIRKTRGGSQRFPWLTIGTTADANAVSSCCTSGAFWGNPARNPSAIRKRLAHCPMRQEARGASPSGLNLGRTVGHGERRGCCRHRHRSGPLQASELLHESYGKGITRFMNGSKGVRPGASEAVAILVR